MCINGVSAPFYGRRKEEDGIPTPHTEFGEIRTILIDGEPWFVGKDVANVLGYERATKAIQDHVDLEDKDEVPIQDSIGRMQKTPLINESGLYSLILSSKLPSAKRFKVTCGRDPLVI